MRTAIWKIAALILIGLSGYQACTFLLVPPSTESTQRTVEIRPGTSFRGVAYLLHEEDVISSPMLFVLLGKLTQAEREIKPGEYSLDARMRPMKVLSLLREGKVVEYPVVIPEGYSSRQIAQVLSERSITDSEEFLQLTEDPKTVRDLGIDGPNLEGYLYPETYHFPKGTRPEAIIRKMVSEFEALWEGQIAARAQALGMTRREVVTLASIIEKETGKPEERRLISGVFHNRLKQGMPLQSDPTVIYAIRDFQGNLTRRHLLTHTPYNTYRFVGLPPGPIANPGRASLLASVDPEETDYLYFVSKNDGSHYFSKTISEHTRAVDRYQRRRR